MFSVIEKQRQDIFHLCNSLMQCLDEFPPVDKILQGQLVWKKTDKWQIRHIRMNSLNCTCHLKLVAK